jgi:hypothetical protein
MKRFILLTFICINTLVAFTQNIEVDKNSGLVKVDGQDAFYLIFKNKGILSLKEISVENLAKEELAFIKERKVEELPWDEREGKAGVFYQFTFSETGNTANIFPKGFSATKDISKAIVNAGLIKEGKMDPRSERNFVVSNNGTIFREPNKPVTVVVNNAPAGNTLPKAAVDISVKGNNIYNNSELIGSFKKSTEAANLTTLSIYNKDDLKIATATHNDADANADWNLTTFADNKATQLLYNTAAPLEKLFKFLAEKGFL